MNLQKKLVNYNIFQITFQVCYERRRKNLFKCAEELNELATRLLQQVNKNKDYTEQIKQELEDVKKQIKMLEKVLE